MLRNRFLRDAPKLFDLPFKKEHARFSFCKKKSQYFNLNIKCFLQKAKNVVIVKKKMHCLVLVFRKAIF